VINKKRACKKEKDMPTNLTFQIDTFVSVRLSVDSSNNGNASERKTYKIVIFISILKQEPVVALA